MSSRYWLYNGNEGGTVSINKNRVRSVLLDALDEIEELEKDGRENMVELYNAKANILMAIVEVER